MSEPEAAGLRYYGWIVLAVASAALAVSAGTRFAFGAALPAMVAERGWDVGVVSGAAAVASAMIGLLQPYVGGLVDRYGPRVVLTAGLVLVGLGAVATAEVRQSWQLYATFGVVAGVGFGATLQLTGGILAAR